MMVKQCTKLTLFILVSDASYVHSYSACICLLTDVVVESLIYVTWTAFVSRLPIELKCNVTGMVVWRINNIYYTLTDLSNGVLQDHIHSGTNILVYTPLINNTEYVCVSITDDGDVSSDPAYFVIFGE